MQYIGLLTDEQKRMGLFISQDEDFIYLFHGKNGDARLVACFLYDTATVKEIRETAEKEKLKLSK
jgi:hypothetical protein